MQEEEYINDKKGAKMIKEFAKSYLDELKKDLDNISLEKVEQLIHLLKEAHDNNGHIFIIGNGGSASLASHMACDLSKGTLKRFYNNGEKRLRVVSLVDNIPLLTALANDLSYEEVFVQQLKSLLKPGDVVLIITGSGNSINLIRAAHFAKERKAKVFGILGFDGGELLHLVDNYIHLPINDYGRIEDCHLVLNHIITSCFYNYKDQLVKNPNSSDPSSN